MKSIHAQRHGSGGTTTVASLDVAVAGRPDPKRQGSGATAHGLSVMKAILQPSKRQQGSGATAKVSD